MNVLEIIAGVLLLAVCIIIIFATMLQNPKQGGLGSSFGGTESYFGKNSGRTMEAVLARVTKFAGIAFLVLTLVVCLINVYVK